METLWGPNGLISQTPKTEPKNKLIQSNTVTKNQFKVAIILVNFRNFKDTVICLNSFLSKISHNTEVILVDNGSKDGSFEKLKSAYPTVTFVELKKNMGFAGANNIAISMAIQNGADYVFLLNNDTIVQSSIIEKLVDVYSKDPTIGIVGTTILDSVNPTKIDNMGAKIDYFTGNSHFIANGVSYSPDLQDINVDYTSGAGMMIKREVIQDVGLLTEYYFLYGEEKEYCVRAKQKGYRVVVTAKAAIIHKTSSTMNKHLGIKNYYFHRNRFLFLRRYAKTRQYLFAILHSCVMLLPFYTFKYLIQGRTTFPEGVTEWLSFISGVFDGLRFKTGYTKKVN